MKRISLFAIIIFLNYTVSGQHDIGTCIRDRVTKADSLVKIGKNPFEQWKDCALNKKLTPFKFVTLLGDTIESEREEGKIIVLNYWFIDCHPCIAEIPGLNKLVAEYKNKNVEFLAVTWEAAKRIKEQFLKKYKLDFKIIPEAEEYINKTMASGYPTTYVVDTNGIIREAWNGGRTDDKAGEEYYEKAKQVINRLLKTQ
jgi:peroxiredoxin